MNKQQILDFTSAFPPAQKLTETLIEIDYRKHYNQFMDSVVIFCAFVAVVYTVLQSKWSQYDMTERCQLAWIQAKENVNQFSNWFQSVLIPFLNEIVKEIICFYNVVKLAGSFR